MKIRLLLIGCLVFPGIIYAQHHPLKTASAPLLAVDLTAADQPLSAPVPQAAIIPELVFPKIGSPAAWTFDQVIAAALISDPKLRISAEDIRQAEADYLTSSLFPNPTLSAEGGALPFRRGRITEETPGGPPQLDIRAEWPIDWFLFAKRQAAMDSALLGVDRAKAEYADVVRQRITGTATLFYDLLEAKALFFIARQDVDMLAGLEKIAKEGVDAGGLPAIELKRISLELMQSRQKLLEEETTLDILKAKLRAQFGSTDHDSLFDINGDLNVPADMAPMPLEEAFEMARQNRPDIRSLQTQVARAEADVILEDRNAYPEVTPFWGYTRQYQRSMGEENYNGWGIGLTISVPLFDRNQGNRARARSALAQSTHSYQAGIVDLRAEIIEAHKNFLTAHQQVNVIAAEELRLAMEVRDAMFTAYKAGGRRLIEVLDAERNYREMYSLFITKRADYWRALYIYNSAVGINSANDLR